MNYTPEQAAYEQLMRQGGGMVRIEYRWHQIAPEDSYLRKLRKTHWYQRNYGGHNDTVHA